MRQRCDFGCVVCGLPLYQYDHIEAYSKVRKHEASNITLLCAKHHDLKTRGQLPAKVVQQRNANPFNRGGGKTAGHDLFYEQNFAAVVAGGNRVQAFGHSADAIKIDGHTLVGFELVEDVLMLNMDLRDGHGGTLLKIFRNEMVHATHHWDYAFVGQRLSIWHAERDIALTILFDAEKGEVVIEKGLVSHNGVEIWIDPRGLCILNNCTLLSGNMMENCRTAIVLGEGAGQEGPAAIAVGIDRGPFDRQAAIVWAREKLADLWHDTRDNWGSNRHRWGETI